ncbi:MAG: alpha/beta hydrolase [Muribaculaceae bacterium]|nr:alpha/beta hydrolase [Muribaculaceae bacterium]MDE6772417.1 alpha/beta hydrolase [Muribaculaceae bacterium]
MNLKSVIRRIFCTTVAVAAASFGAYAAGRVFNLDNVECTVYLPDPSMASGRAIVILPGGGYSHHAMEHEGHQWAPFFNGQGIAVAVLKYRLPNGDRSIPMNDVKTTFRTLRDSAENWKINPADIGIMGSSAGGHLASSIATHTDGVEKPDFQILFYPVVSLDPAITHAGTRTGFLGKSPILGDQEEFSNANVVDAGTPPAIIFHSNDDTAVHPLNAIGYYTALQKAGVPASLHIYPTGGHGWGFRKSFQFHDQVLEELEAWLRWLPAKKQDK